MALRYAADHGAAALSISQLGFPDFPEQQKAIQYAASKGLVFIDINYQGQNPLVVKPDVLPDELHRTWGNKQADIGVCGYDSREASARKNDGWGRSNTAPAVAGVIALMKSANSSLTVAQLKKILLDSARHEDGYSVLDASQAVLNASKEKSSH
jgi:subtilisin family serine protease